MHFTFPVCTTLDDYLLFADVQGDRILKFEGQVTRNAEVNRGSL